jgi:hypothetical protein
MTVWRGRQFAVLGLAVAAYCMLAPAEAPPPGAQAAASVSDISRVAFDRWLARSRERADEFARFEAFLARRQVSGIVPAWQLLRSDARSSARCAAEPFALPPRMQWQAIVPALQIVRERVVPALGPVEVASAWRPHAFNRCAGGARNSRHLSFAAVDLRPTMQPNAETSFRILCRSWRAAGPSSRWGLGAYHDRDHPQHSRLMRFHVDGTGYRTWGFSYRQASSACNYL